jgi:hypothetical protein
MLFTDNDTSDYRGFLQHLVQAGYEFAFFNDLGKSDSQVVMRHDIDFDCRLAYEMALAEQEMNVISTYFFLVSSESYNIASAQNRKYIEAIRDMGHCVSIHFDPLNYDDFEEGFRTELDYFQKLFHVKVDIISIHRPNEFFQQYDSPILSVEHTYQKKYFKDLKYFADSTGLWRFGHPFHSPEFAERKNLHILVHPIWWTMDGQSNSEIIYNHYRLKVDQTKTHYQANCKSFIDIS